MEQRIEETTEKIGFLCVDDDVGTILDMFRATRTQPSEWPFVDERIMEKDPAAAKFMKDSIGEGTLLNRPTAAQLWENFLVWAQSRESNVFQNVFVNVFMT